MPGIPSSAPFVTAGVGSVTLAWGRPSKTGHLPITGYAIKFEPGGRVVQVKVVKRGPTLTPTSNLYSLKQTLTPAYHADLKP